MFRLNIFNVIYNRCLTRTVSVWFDEHNDNARVSTSVRHVKTTKDQKCNMCMLLGSSMV